MHKSPILSGIYEYTFTGSSRSYIGSSVNLRRRNDQHMSKLRNNCHCNTDFQKAFNKFGLSNLKYKVLEYIDNEKLLQKYITKKEFQILLFGVEQTYLDKYYAQEYLKNSKDTRFFQLLYNKSVLAVYNCTELTLERQKTVYKYDLEGNYIEEYFNSEIANLCTNIDSSSIRRVCLKQRVSAGRFLWRHEKYDKIAPYKRADQKSVNQFNSDKEFIKRFNSIEEAMVETGIDIRKGKSHSTSMTHGGYYFLFDGEDFPEWKRPKLKDNLLLEIKKKIGEFRNKTLKYGEVEKFIQTIMTEYSLSRTSAYGIYYNYSYK